MWLRHTKLYLREFGLHFLYYVFYSVCHAALLWLFSVSLASKLSGER